MKYLAIGILLAFLGCSPEPTELPPRLFDLASSAFLHGGEIPKRFTCEGVGVSPPLVWSGVPADTKSFILLMEDPDSPDPNAPSEILTHWTIYNLPGKRRALLEGDATWQDRSPAGYQIQTYVPPCPKLGRHRYYFRLFALNEVVPPLLRPTREELIKAIDGRLLGVAQLVGTYQRHHGRHLGGS